MTVYNAFLVYANLHVYLTGWAGNWVSQAGACRVASIATSRLFQQATVLYDCEDGPYADLLALAVPLLLRQGSSEGVTKFGAVESHPVIPEDEFMSVIAWCYSCTYMAAQMGDWTFAEREEVARAIRMWHPKQASSDECDSWLDSGLLASVPLRRAVKALDAHTCGGDLVCEAAFEAQVLHTQAGLEWARTARRLEALSS